MLELKFIIFRKRGRWSDWNIQVFAPQVMGTERYAVNKNVYITRDICAESDTDYLQFHIIVCQVIYKYIDYSRSYQRFQNARFSLLWKLIRKSKDYVYGMWVYKALDIWKGYYWVKKNHRFRTWNRDQRQEIINIWNITPNLHTNSHFEMWAEKWTIMQEPSGSSTAPNAARRISC